jgi:peptidoglycan lytic transglycosylase
MRSSDAFVWIVLVAAPVAAIIGQLRPLGAEETVQAEPLAQQHGDASYYSDKFAGQPTATGETFSQNKLTAASRELPLGTRATVTNEENGKSVNVKINDRGPYVNGRVIDLSKKAASKIGIKEQGIAPVKVEARPSSQPTEDLKEAVKSIATPAQPSQ